MQKRTIARANSYTFDKSNGYVGRVSSEVGPECRWLAFRLERDQLIAELTAATDVTQARGSVTRKVAEDADLRQRESNRAFVLMQYYGYLRRNPDDPQDSDFRGWEFWVNKLNQFNGNFVNADMMKSFLVAGEYRQRFGP